MAQIATLDRESYVDVNRFRKIARRQRESAVLILGFQADALKLGKYERQHLMESDRNAILVQRDNNGRLRRIVFTGGIHRTHFHRGGSVPMPAIIEFSDRTGDIVEMTYWQYGERM